MKYKSYKEHLEKWNKSKELVSEHNQELINQWRSIPWWKFWSKPTFEEQRQIIMDNWSEFNKLPVPRLMDYYPLTFSSLKTK